jgi:hypothetical protein
MAMNMKLKSRWIKALRSGQYRQTITYLGDTRGGKEYNCCLGVLARVARLKLNRENESGSWPLPDEILDWDTQRMLSRMNDDGKSFEDIATYLEGEQVT